MEVCFYILLLLASGVNGYNQEHDSNTESKLEETLSKIGSLFENLELIYQLKPTLTEIVINNREAARIMCVSGDPVVIQMEFSKGGKIVTISKYVNGNLNHKSMLWQMNDRDSELLDQLETDSGILPELVKIRIELIRAEQILESLKDQFDKNWDYLSNKDKIKILFEKVEKFKGSLKGTNNCFKWKKAVIVAGGVTGAALLSAAVVGLIALMGFTPTGIAAGSIAAWLMSSAAVANGGGIAAGSMVAILQAIGATGLGATLGSIVASAGLLSGSAASAMIAELIDWMYYGC